MDAETKEHLIAGLRNYKAALKEVTAKVTALIDGVVDLTEDRARDIRSEFDAVTDAGGRYDQAVDAAGLLRSGD